MFNAAIVALYVILEVTYPSGVHMEATMRLTGFESMEQCKLAIPDINIMLTQGLWSTSTRDVFCITEGDIRARDDGEEE